MKRALLISTVSGFVPQFEGGNVHILQSLGYEIHYASNFHNVFYGKTNEKMESLNMICHQIDFERSPFRLTKNIHAYRQLKKLARRGMFSLVHCHTPMGGALGRIAFKKCKACRVYYTAHGFHFYKGAPASNWMLYYPAERLLSKWTDVLITINKEDYKRAKKFQAKKVVYIPGVGIDLDKYMKNELDISKKREALGLSETDRVVLSVGELNQNKNHKVIIKALSGLRQLNITYLLCGEGPLKQELIEEARLCNVKLVCLGYRLDVAEIYRIADIFVFPSKREGLSVALMEAMASGLPVVCSKIRGNQDLIKNEENGLLCRNEKDYEIAIKRLLCDQALCRKFSNQNRITIKKFSKEEVEKTMKREYIQADSYC